MYLSVESTIVFFTHLYIFSIVSVVPQYDFNNVNVLYIMFINSLCTALLKKYCYYK